MAGVFEGSRLKLLKWPKVFGVFPTVKHGNAEQKQRRSKRNQDRRRQARLQSELHRVFCTKPSQVHGPCVVVFLCRWGDLGAAFTASGSANPGANRLLVVQ